jgi:hypothetical protein
MAVVNSEEEAEVLRILYLNYGPASVQREGRKHGKPKPATTTTQTTTQQTTPQPTNATVHIGFHDIFIEGEYLTVRSK